MKRINKAEAIDKREKGWKVIHTRHCWWLTDERVKK